MMRTMRLVLALGFAAASCSSEPSNPADLIAGTYTLRTINGQVLPFVWVENDPQNRVSFSAGTLTLKSDGTFSDLTTFTVLVDGQPQDQPLDATGTWTLAGTTLTLVPDGAETYTMTWDNNDRLTQMFDNLVLLYQKQ